MEDNEEKGRSGVAADIRKARTLPTAWRDGMTMEELRQQIEIEEAQMAESGQKPQSRTLKLLPSGSPTAQDLASPADSSRSRKYKNSFTKKLNNLMSGGDKTASLGEGRKDKKKDPLPIGVFFQGAPLEQQPRDPDYDLPLIVVAILEYYYRKEAYLEEGIFRISGSMSEIQSLKQQCDEAGPDVVRERVLLDHNSPHDIASLLKTWLKELPEPLIPIDQFLSIIEANKTENEDLKASKFATIVAMMPPLNRNTLKHILNFSNVIVENQEVNKMKLTNVANVLAPTIMRTKDERDFMTNFGVAGGCLVFMLQHFDDVFGHYTPLPFMEKHANRHLSLANMSIDLSQPI